MSFKPPLPKIAGPLTLPGLLSILPKHGKHQIVKPSTCKHPDRVFLITRTRLKFKTYDPASKGQQQGGKDQADSKSLNISPKDGQVRAFGKAWGMEFVGGQLRKDPSPIKLPDPRVQTRSKQNWIAIDPNSLPPHTKEAVKNWSTIMKDSLAQRQAVLEKRASEFAELNEKGRTEFEQAALRRKAWDEERRKVKIIY